LSGCVTSNLNFNPALLPDTILITSTDSSPVKSQGRPQHNDAVVVIDSTPHTPNAHATAQGTDNRTNQDVINITSTESSPVKSLGQSAEHDGDVVVTGESFRDATAKQHAARRYSPAASSLHLAAKLKMAESSEDSDSWLDSGALLSVPHKRKLTLTFDKDKLYKDPQPGRSGLAASRVKRDQDEDSDIEDLSHALPLPQSDRDFWHVWYPVARQSEHLDTEGLKRAIEGVAREQGDVVLAAMMTCDVCVTHGTPHSQ
jgi:hypothetical protein